MAFFNINLITFIIQLLYFSKYGGEFALKLFSFKLNIRPYNRLGKEATSYKKQ